MVRIIIDRLLEPGMEDMFIDTIIELRREAGLIKGYISGETMRDADDPNHFIVISTWRSREHWDNWTTSNFRQEMVARLKSMLARPERVTILQHI